jgi:uncharacterized protein YbdZ (MbtH family)
VLRPLIQSVYVSDVGRANLFLAAFADQPISFCTMSHINSAEFGIIVSEEHQFNIWPTRYKLPPNWHHTGPVGTHEQMQKLLDQQFLTTLAATYLRAETRFRDSQLAD